MNVILKNRLIAWPYNRRLLRVLLMLSIAMPLSDTPAFADGAAKEGNKLVYAISSTAPFKPGGKQTITIQAWGRDGLRVRVAPDGGGQTSDWSLDIPLETEGKIEISPTESTLRNGKISVRIRDIHTHRGHMEFFRHSGDRKIPILSEEDYEVWSHNPNVRSFKPASDGLFHSELHFAARDGERFYGMGQNAGVNCYYPLFR